MSRLEPITHLLTGACISRAGLNRTTGLATLTLVLATEAPDLDVVYYFVGGSVTGFEHHRGFTHTFLGAPVVAAIVVAVVYGFYRLMARRGWKPKLAPRWSLLYAYALLGALVHIFQDFSNHYGVRPLAPFNPRWYSWDIVFIFDPIMLAALILGLAVPGVLALIKEEVGAGKPQFRGRGGAILALICLAVVILVRDVEHRRALAALNSITYRNEDPLRVGAYPFPLNPFVWGGVVETRDFFEILPVDSLSGQVDPQNQARIRFKPEETPVTLAAKKSRLGQVYLDWARFPLVESERLPAGAGYLVQFQDLRFASAARGASSPLTGYVELDPQLRATDAYLGERNREETRH
ncbi:MAG TPA: metal-dependent hydrolase [Candidatus Angelobacter sp.]